MKPKLRILHCLVGFILCWATEAFGKDLNQQEQVKIDTLTDSCLHSIRKDQICLALIELRQLGYDSVEMIKEYARLTPRQYALLTMANAVATGRIRIRTHSHFFKEGNDILDIQKDSTALLFETRF